MVTNWTRYVCIYEWNKIWMERSLYIDWNSYTAIVVMTWLNNEWFLFKMWCKDMKCIRFYKEMFGSLTWWWWEHETETSLTFVFLNLFTLFWRFFFRKHKRPQEIKEGNKIEILLLPVIHLLFRMVVVVKYCEWIERNRKRVLDWMHKNWGSYSWCWSSSLSIRFSWRVNQVLD